MIALYKCCEEFWPLRQCNIAHVIPCWGNLSWRYYWLSQPTLLPPSWAHQAVFGSLSVVMMSTAKHSKLQPSWAHQAVLGCPSVMMMSTAKHSNQSLNSFVCVQLVHFSFWHSGCVHAHLAVCTEQKILKVLLPSNDYRLKEAHICSSLGITVWGKYGFW